MGGYNVMTDTERNELVEKLFVNAAETFNKAVPGSTTPGTWRILYSGFVRDVESLGYVIIKERDFNEALQG